MNKLTDEKKKDRLMSEDNLFDYLHRKNIGGELALYILCTMVVKYFEEFKKSCDFLEMKMNFTTKLEGIKHKIDNDG